MPPLMILPRMKRKRRYCIFHYLILLSLFPVIIHWFCSLILKFFQTRIKAYIYIYIVSLPWTILLVQSIIPKIFSSKRNNRSGSNDDDILGSEGSGVSLGIPLFDWIILIMSYFTYNINSIDAYIIYTHVNVFLFSFFFFLFLFWVWWADVEKNIAARKKTFTEASPLMRKSFSGMCV